MIFKFIFFWDSLFGFWGFSYKLQVIFLLLVLVIEGEMLDLGLKIFRLVDILLFREMIGWNVGDSKRVFGFFI